MADTPSQPSPEILEKLRQLREELAQKAAQQAPKDANTLAWQQSNAFKRIYPRAEGGQIDMDRMRLELMGKAKGGSVMGVNVASDRKHNLNYADLIVDGHKTIESRNTDSLRPYVGKRVAIVRTGHGPAKAIGEVTIGEPMVVNKKKFRSLERQHMVPAGSAFDISTPTKHLYPLSDPQRYEQEHDVGHGIIARKVMHKADGGEMDDDYRSSHTAPSPEFGAPMHDVTRDMYPKDFYGPNGFRIYADYGEHKDRDAYNKVMRVRGKPDEMVSIHRAIPTKVYKEALKKEAPLKHMIRKGDWVAINKDYAKEHGDSVLLGDYKIASMRVPARHVWTNADSIHEWGYHPEEEKKAKGGSVPKKTVTAYKLFRVHPKHPNKLFPLFVNANEPVEMNKWVDAKEGEMAGDKVKSKIGPLAYRPGWHAGDLPIATHIGEKSNPSLTAPDIRPANHVWAEVEMPNDVDWQSVANERGMNPKGKLIARNAHITDQIPKGGHYRYKTNSNMTGNWLIGGSMKVNRILSDKEVKALNKAAGAADLPRIRPFRPKDYGFASGGVVAPQEWMAEEHVNYKRNGGVAHLAIGGQGGSRNWLKGSVEQVIHPLKSKVTTENFVNYTPEQVQQMVGSERIKRNDAVNQWIERNLANYIRKQMATHDDPIRKLAEEGIVHMPPEQMGLNRHYADDYRRMMEGTRLAKSPEARAWEDATDVTMARTNVKNLLEVARLKGPHDPKTIEPWMEKADPETHLFYPRDSMHAHYLGFDHLVDVLKEDLAEGRIRPEQLNKVSIEQAVRRAYEYDQEKKRKMAETALKATENMPVHKDYGNGFKWIELKMPEELPEGWTKKTGALGETLHYDPQGRMSVNPNQEKLEQALKYEGDTMGHCVGGYCPDVASGKTRIFSLRDAKNEPHVTIEVKPKSIQEGIRNLPDEERFALAQEVKDQHFGGVMPHVRDEDKYWDLMDKHYVAKHGMPAPSIKQIKGKQNQKPKKDYIPYVQDFVKSGNWSNVGDINNAEMRDIHPESDLAKAMQQKGLQAPKYVTEQEMSGLLKEHNQGLYSWNKAKGGRVTHAHHLDIEERPL